MLNMLGDIALLNPETIQLEPEEIQQASHNSRQVASDLGQWQVYLQGLAVLGLQRSLQQRLATQAWDTTGNTLYQPGYSSLLDAACRLQIGPFQLCVIATESIIDGVIKIPQAAVELPDLAAHFYVVVEVIEEQEELIVRGVLRSDRLQAYLDSVGLTADQDWQYRVPLSLFEREPHRLAFYVEHLDATAIALPTVAANFIPETQAVDDLQGILAELSATMPLWRQLTWPQAATILQSPELLSELHRWQQSSPTRDLLSGVQTVFEDTRQQVINLAQWLNAGLDEMAESLGFMTADQLSPALEMRSQALSVMFEGAIATLRDDGLPIPQQVRPVYWNVAIDGLDLCLCLLPYHPSETLEAPAAQAEDWSLLVIVGSQSDHPLPVGFGLQIKRGDALLESITLEFEEMLVYSSVDARVNETLQVEVIAPSGISLPLPLFTYDAGES